jgi:hypothetical protein
VVSSFQKDINILIIKAYGPAVLEVDRNDIGSEDVSK